MQKVVKIAYSLNRPLLCSEQAFEDVFKQQKNSAFGEIKYKFDVQMKEVEASHAEAKEKLEG